jgi:hypothetical protein
MREGFGIEKHRRRAVQVSVEPTGVNQLIVRSLLFDHAVVQHYDSIHPFQRGDPMRDKHNGLLGEMLGQIHEYSPFRRSVKG